MNAPKISPKLGFDIEKHDNAMKAGYRLEVAPLGPFYRMRFFNEVESIMLIGNREQVRQIHREIGSALGLAADRKKRARQSRK